MNLVLQLAPGYTVTLQPYTLAGVIMVSTFSISTIQPCSTIASSVATSNELLFSGSIQKLQTLPKRII
jgi:hypothetical protein